ncbi:2-methylisocitrate lyase-like PEP mutase family enzyme [Rhodoligotrophos appendicifer]|uniref:isocitrate lyase/PEP mutase family protein n=1 Tax=Rhodoligotrophos appendicifer TaxID=987056 RepID=UPI001186B93B|nr:isocitrate lyase/PEP mutase family protein [Rhodoligotrophos appendicifer]
MPDIRLKQRLHNGEFILAPGIYDLISALIADAMDFPALYVTGYGTVASYLGLPDAGIATYTDMINRISTMAERTRTPIIADADTGYGGLLNVRNTVRGYERAGVSALQIEDQQFPKKCGHTKNRRVIPASEMVDKIKVAVDTRNSEAFLLIARTDARTALGLNEALDRGHAYAEAGADILFIESPETEDELAQVGRSFSVPVLANMVDGGRTPILSADRLKELGFALAIHPGLGFLSAGSALRDAYAHLQAHGTSADLERPTYDFQAFNTLIGFEDVWAFEEKYRQD